MGRRTRELLAAAILVGCLGWALYTPVYRSLVPNPAMARAVKEMDTEAIRRLAYRGADVNLNLRLISSEPSATFALETPLRVAIALDDRKTLQVLIQRGVDVNQVSGKGETPLMFAVAAGAPGIAEDLLQVRARVNALDEKGRTAPGWM